MPRKKANAGASESKTTTLTRKNKPSPTRGKESYRNPLASLSFEGKVILNSEQKLVVADIFNSDSLTLVTGEPGTGKSMVSMYCAFKLLKTRSIKKVIVTRPTVEAGGRGLGFIPGTEHDKLGVYLEPFREFCALFGNSGDHTYEDMVRTGQIEAVAFQFMRGRNFDSDTLVILDEGQNTNVEEMLMLLTRMKEGSRLIVNGDYRQKDTKKHEYSGLAHLEKVAKVLDYIKHHHLTINERSPKIKQLITTWDSIEQKG